MVMLEMSALLHIAATTSLAFSLILFSEMYKNTMLRSRHFNLIGKIANFSLLQYIIVILAGFTHSLYLPFISLILSTGISYGMVVNMQRLIFFWAPGLFYLSFVIGCVTSFFTVFG